MSTRTPRVPIYSGNTFPKAQPQAARLLFPTSSNANYYISVNHISTPLPAKSPAQLTLTEALTNGGRWLYGFYGAEAKTTRSEQRGGTGRLQPRRRWVSVPQGHSRRVEAQGKRQSNTPRYRTDRRRKVIQVKNLMLASDKMAAPTGRSLIF